MISQNQKDRNLIKCSSGSGRTIIERPDFIDTVQGMVDATALSLGAKGCTLGFFDPLEGDVQLLASTGLSESCLSQGSGWAQTDLGSIVNNDEVLILDSEDRSHNENSDGVVSFVGIRLKINEELNLVLSIYHDHPLFAIQKCRQFYSNIKRQSIFTIKNAIQESRYKETFRQVSAAIHTGEKIETILDNIVSHVKEIVNARGCIYWIVDTDRENVHLKATSGFEMGSLSSINYKTLEEIFRFHEDAEVYFENVSKDPRIPSTTSLGKQMVTSILGLPFQIVGPYRGILAVYFSQTRLLRYKEIDFIRALGQQGAIALHKAFRYDERLFNTFRQTIAGLVLALEAKDACTHGHSLNVATYAHETAIQMGLPEEEADTIYHAALLHDIGKIAMHDELLENLGNLAPGEFETVKQHPVIGARIVGPLSFLTDAAPLILHHHERYDGSGYPNGLAGDAIPLGARIIAVSDSFDAMTSQRPGTQAIDVQKALSRLLEQAGTIFDPIVVKGFVLAVKANREMVKPYKLSADKEAKTTKTLDPTRASKYSLTPMLKKCMLGF